MSDEPQAKSTKPPMEVRPHALLAAKRPLVPDDDDAIKAYPTLLSLLLPVYDDHGRLCREGASLSIRVDGSLYRATLSCPTEGYQGTVTTNRLLMFLGDIEQVINLPDFNWTKDYDSLKKSKQRLKELLGS